MYYHKGLNSLPVMLWRWPLRRSQNVMTICPCVRPCRLQMSPQPTMMILLSFPRGHFRSCDLSFTRKFDGLVGKKTPQVECSETISTVIIQMGSSTRPQQLYLHSCHCAISMVWQTGFFGAVDIWARRRRDRERQGFAVIIQPYQGS
jgi:hypothetical protein